MWVPEPVKDFLITNPPKPLGEVDKTVDKLLKQRDKHKEQAKKNLCIAQDLTNRVAELCPHSDLTVTSQSNEDEFGRMTNPTWYVVCKKCEKVMYEYSEN